MTSDKHAERHTSATLFVAIISDSWYSPKEKKRGGGGG